MAITEVVTEIWRDNAALFLQCQASAPLDDVGVKRMRSLLWNDIREQLQQGKLVATGCRYGETRRLRIEPGFFAAAEPNYEADSATSHGVTFFAVRICPAKAVVSQNPTIAAELADWHTSWRKAHPQASDAEAEMMARRAGLPGVTRAAIRSLQHPPYEKPRPRGRKRGKRSVDQLR